MILSWHYLADHKVRGAKVVRPLRDAVDLVYAGERDRREAAQELVRFGGQSLGRHKQSVQIVGSEICIHSILYFGRLTGVQTGDTQTTRPAENLV